MAFWTDREGNKLTFSEFKARWKAGIAQVSQLQQVVAQIRFTWMTLFGIICGIVISTMKFDTLWWLVIILVAACGNTGVGLLALAQKRLALEKLESQLRIINLEENSVKGGQS